MNRKNKYAVGQHKICCEEFDVSPLPTDPGPTLYDVLLDARARGDKLREERDQAREMVADLVKAMKAVEKTTSEARDTFVKHLES